MTRAPKDIDSLRSFQAAAAKAAEQPYELRLFIAGTTPLSSSALTVVKSICEERLEGRYELTVIDVYQQPARAKDDQIIAVPTLLKRSPLPQRRIIGDLSDRAMVLAGLGLTPDPPSQARARHDEEA